MDMRLDRAKRSHPDAGFSGPAHLPQKFSLDALNTCFRAVYAAQFAHFKYHMGYRPNLAMPKTWHEKMLWRKLFDRNPQFTLLCDKLAAKQYIRDRLPELPIPKTLWAGKTLQDAPRELINPEIVIKTNHGCAFNYFPARETLSHAQLCQCFAGWMKINYGASMWEWGYYGIDRKIFIEERIAVAKVNELLDISIECADGKAIYGYITIREKMGEKADEKRLTNYDIDGEQLQLHGNYQGAENQLPKDLAVRENYLQAVQYAQILSRGLDYIRIDFLGTGTQLYAGEITCYPMGGVFKPTPPGKAGTDTLVNPCWDLRKSWFLRHPQSGWKGVYAEQLRRAVQSS